MSEINITALVAKTVGKTSEETLKDPRLFNLVKALVLFEGLPKADQLEYLAFLKCLQAGKNK